MPSIVLLKHLHIALAIVSVSFFLVRFVGRQMGAGFVQSRLVKTAPHLVDTLLLASGIALASLYRLSPLEAHWLLVKLVFIVAYIGAGFGAMKMPGSGQRNAFALLALGLIATVVWLARVKPL